ncbi:MAG: transporter substrate-binding domain-containing protein [Desulfotignum sp.]|nr:transporter substrate-binding domain-containing protein [Desulfotignum sp.]MCF8087063.1 transporter substrate-binding domain-containing protein [Desulfotignum sp.]MCF8139177.1 transporter substrate-binding domain-containing protein [Desulfotignum sp.]
MNNRHPIFRFFAVTGLIIFSILGQTGFCENPILSAAVPQLTPEEQAWLSHHDGRVRLAHTPDWPPMDFLDKSGTPTGMAADYVRVIEKKLDFNFRVVPVKSWSEMLARAREGTIDVISAGQETEARKKFMTWSTPFLNLKTTIIVRKQNTMKLSLDQMRGMRIGVARQYAVGEFIRQQYPYLTMVDVSNPLEGIRMVSFGELDAMITEVPNALYIIETEKITNLRLAGDTGFELKHGMGIRKDWPVFSRIIEKTLASITQDEHNDIYRRWVKLHTQSVFQTRTFWYSVLGTAAVIMLVMGTVVTWNIQLKRQVNQRTEALRRNETGLEALLALNEQPHGSIQTIVEFAFRQMLELTQSRFGYLSFRNQDGITHVLDSSNSENGKQFYTLKKSKGFTTGTKGLWGDAVRLGRPVISNDYAVSNPNRRGLPEGCKHITRYMNVPIFKDNEIVVLAGMGNKPTDYTASDLRQLSLLAHGMWRMIQRKTAEHAMLKSEKRFNDLVEHSPNAIAIVRENRVVYNNANHAALIGALNLLDPSKDERLHPDDLPGVISFFDQIVRNDLTHSEVAFRFFKEKPGVGKGRMKWVSCIATPIEYNDRDAFLLIFIDMTEEKRLQHLLTIQDKMASLGQVSAGIAHEIRNPLSGINIHLDIIEKFFHDPNKADKTVTSIQAVRSASHKIELVIRRVMNFAKPTEPRFDRIQINDPVREAIKLTRVTLNKKEIDIVEDLADGLPECFAEPNLMEELILNLINNASDALSGIKSNGVIKVTSTCRNHRIRLTVEDNGPGIDQTQKQKIFDPFFTTKKNSTGIGLSLCHRIVTDHRGELTAGESELGGAAFTIEIPTQPV